MTAGTVVQVLQDLFLCFIACFILLMIAPLPPEHKIQFTKCDVEELQNTTSSCFRKIFPAMGPAVGKIVPPPNSVG